MSRPPTVDDCSATFASACTLSTVTPLDTFAIVASTSIVPPTALKGAVGGTIDVDATIANVSSGVTVDSVQADAKVALQSSTVGGLDISRANVDAGYHNATADIRTLDIVG